MGTAPSIQTRQMMAELLKGRQSGATGQLAGLKGFGQGLSPGLQKRAVMQAAVSTPLGRSSYSLQDLVQRAANTAAPQVAQRFGLAR